MKIIGTKGQLFAAREGRRISRIGLLMLGTAAALVFSQPAFAQSASATAKDAEADGSVVIVTARRRSESVQEVPSTINVLKGAELTESGVFRFSELQFAVPGFYVQNYETRATITMRGIGSQVEGGTSAVAIHSDGIYQASAAAQLNRLFDVERVEVLKGPQGTLYGRNSTGGAVNIINRKAGATFEGELSAGYGSFNTVNVASGVSIPLGEGWGLRLAGSYAKGDGLFTNVVNGQKIGKEDFIGARATLSGEVGAVKVDLFAQYSKDNDSRNIVLIPLQTGTKIPLLGFDKTAYDDPVNPATKREPLLAGLTLETELGNGFTMRAITGYLDYSEPRSDTDVNPRPNLANRLFISFPQSAKQLSQELQFLYQGDRLDGVFGVYYLDDQQQAKRLVVQRPSGLTLLNSNSRDDVEAFAVYGDVNYELSDRLKVNAGMRWNREKIRNQRNGSGLFDGDPFDLSGTQSKPTGRLGLSYELAPGYMVYGSVSNGFLAGSFSTTLDSVTALSKPKEVLPEKLLSYELGIKTSLPENRGFLNASVFQYDYDDLQVTVGGLFLLPNGQPDPSAPPFFFTDNAAKSRITGFEADLSEFRVATHLKFDANVSYVDAKYLQYTSILSNRSVANFSGNTMPRAPKWTYSTAATVDKLKFGEKIEGSIRAEINYRDKTFFTRENTSVSSQGSYTLVNLIAKLEFDDGRWGFQVAGRNLTDERFFNFLRNDPFATVGEFRSVVATVNTRF
ncbi:TonB-dependent receptor [Aquidulcibacter sp.]|uniref:TonB-dependent receptor n=1 Tax=Aquidulcibacter sp. TaxID=2052990 RepID=UPI0028ABAB9A|nr:TonB-dependent receptor [Aquidulcibacter sp.]